MESKKLQETRKFQTNTVGCAEFSTGCNLSATANSSWTCSVCTLINSHNAYECEVCGTVRTYCPPTAHPKSSLPVIEVPKTDAAQAVKKQSPVIPNSSQQAEVRLPQPFSAPIKPCGTEILSALGLKRLNKERKELENKKIEGVRLLKDMGIIWLVQIDGAKNTLYENETFTIRFKFNSRYPFDAPEVIFIDTPPVHPHVYSNGHICLSILYEGWTPVLGVVSVCLSLISMLSSCVRKQKPIDDRAYCVRIKSKQSPKATNWYFHDDDV